MESYQLAKANIKILDVEEGEKMLWVRFTYQWRDKHRQPQWAEDVVTVPRKVSEYDELLHSNFTRPTGPADVRKTVYNIVQDARAKLEVKED